MRGQWRTDGVKEPSPSDPDSGSRTQRYQSPGQESVGKVLLVMGYVLRTCIAYVHMSLLSLSRPSIHSSFFLSPLSFHSEEQYEHVDATFMAQAFFFPCFRTKRPGRRAIE